MTTLSQRSLILSGALAALACTAEVQGDGAPAPSTSSGGSSAMLPNPSTPLECGTPSAPRAPLRRLTRFEYNNSVRDLGLDDAAPADALPGEEVGNGFGNDADQLTVSPLLIDGYRSVAQQIAERIGS